MFDPMEEAHIYIYGIIDWSQDDYASEWGLVNLKSIKQQVDAQKDAKSLTVHIHSPGGVVSEGFAIHDFLRSQGKPVTTIIEGECASIATVIALAGDTRKMTSNADFMIHMPWGMAAGESEEIQKYADELKRNEDKIADFYVSKTNLNKETVLDMMKKETFMSAEEALTHGFITEIATVMKAVALLKTKTNPNSKQMAKDSLTKEEAQGMFAKFEEKMKNLFGGGKKPEAKLVQDANGNEIDFPDLAEDDTPSVGDKATIDGAAAEGEHVMPSGETYVFTAGELTEIQPKEEEAEDSNEEEVENLKTEVENLKKELKTTKAEKKTAEEKLQTNEKAIQDLQKEFKAFKKDFGSSFNHDPKKKNFKEGSKSRSVWKEKE
ncbi:ATP-dependent Clp endopeptidase, proteolytic subunit ClpP [Salinimicrobium sediminis]|uniref:ATP-dependent Clp protease proteolytic subunit n=1 Tax=Salinimicrobium sediminis TaxID=1343891 RepID=A0A285X4X8_9FLAO|nr:head maturation protease, ClpP-related [Salinimicrobium sediminis]SOC79824.1 ATP-dependent Clp endopeptidase, proteolytic subunit ClpP [Salinimicrobium sediminis]